MVFLKQGALWFRDATFGCCHMSWRFVFQIDDELSMFFKSALIMYVLCIGFNDSIEDGAAN
jgi:hypothetical protein